MANKLMTKADLLASLAALKDDDLILIKCDGGDYWGQYMEAPQVTILPVYYGIVDGQSLGHPGVTDPAARMRKLPETGLVALLAE